jgi:hypothetical protein
LFTYVIERGIEQGMIGIDMLKGHLASKSVYAREESWTVDYGCVRPGMLALLGGLRDWAGRFRSPGPRADAGDHQRR